MKKCTLMLNNPDGITRHNEPVIARLFFKEQPIDPSKLKLVNEQGKVIPHQLFDIVYDDDTDTLISACSIAFIVTNLDQLVENYNLYLDEKTPVDNANGIKQLVPTLNDGVKRLDTGHYILELCRGTADGTSYGKWGIRYFSAKAEGRNLIKDCSNAIGGFYGPFFTPANGLINPPEHTIVECETEVEGPIYCRYRFNGKIPNGLDPALHDKSFSIVWEFFYQSPWFRRTYYVDDFETSVDGMPVINKITVGDEYESGKNNVVFSRFASYGGTFYRQGDLYANILADEVNRILSQPLDQLPPNARLYRESIGDNINAVSWDFFWRLFCVKEGILSDEEIKAHVKTILRKAHHVVHNSARNKEVLFAKDVDVNSVPEQTIFPLAANKTAEINPESGYAMVWYTSNIVGRYQIVQRKDSGWVNWGTNGENEYPELPTGSTIYTAYGQFDDWQKQADSMEKNIDVKQGLIEDE
ncbi:hypothetical protein [Gilliamella apis]|uniref:Uncharacterized protein n=1 Tax=Gilliamella apis TaxID=1970738 RepID=A0A242NWZ3_9GAMM|nr:hypothetical protein [Gilliamella apis]OTQ34228.1 hypothetical protein B6C84_10520 [Gilliamella apis]OTQ34929.1 hypothetical protein B6C88_10720 [Gilliamella apis]OTQ40269.1 hypothetical protein B6C94_10455 [Gilliamella apis]OTQ40429.1 hypothetical protein B6D26_06000 [Gilliamella apis]OTQ44520.1 hypothetical protein B6C86_10325 [Gilliamella apis]